VLTVEPYFISTAATGGKLHFGEFCFSLKEFTVLIAEELMLYYLALSFPIPR